jgi:hypothetical protein
MNPKKYALIGGILMLAFGAAALVPNLSQYPTDGTLLPLDVNTSYGLFLNMFPMNIFNKLALIVFGVLGIWAANVQGKNLSMSMWWSRAVLFVMGAAAIVGLIPQTCTLYGYWPMYGATVYSHAVFAILGGIFGYALSTKASHNEQVKMAEMPKFARDRT